MRSGLASDRAKAGPSSCWPAPLALLGGRPPHAPEPAGEIARQDRARPDARGPGQAQGGISSAHQRIQKELSTPTTTAPRSSASLPVESLQRASTLPESIDTARGNETGGHRRAGDEAARGQPPARPGPAAPTLPRPASRSFGGPIMDDKAPHRGSVPSTTARDPRAAAPPFGSRTTRSGAGVIVPASHPNVFARPERPLVAPSAGGHWRIH